MSYLHSAGCSSVWPRACVRVSPRLLGVVTVFGLSDEEHHTLAFFLYCVATSLSARTLACFRNSQYSLRPQVNDVAGGFYLYRSHKTRTERKRAFRRAPDNHTRPLHVVGRAPRGATDNYPRESFSYSSLVSESPQSRHLKPYPRNLFPYSSLVSDRWDRTSRHLPTRLVFL